MVDEAEIVSSFADSLAELTSNAKPQITFLTMLAEENKDYASKVVQCIETHIKKAPQGHRLPCLYLVDSIVKNLKECTNYQKLFELKIIPIFIAVFERADEQTRQALYRVRLTWRSMSTFSATKLYGIDIKANAIDPNWPIIQPVRESSSGEKLSATPASTGTGGRVHINPKFMVDQPKSEEDPKEKQLKDLQRQREALLAQHPQIRSSVVIPSRDPRKRAQPSSDAHHHNNNHPSNHSPTNNDNHQKKDGKSKSQKRAILDRYEEEKGREKDRDRKKDGRKDRNYRRKTFSRSPSPARDNGAPSSSTESGKKDVDLRALPPKKRHRDSTESDQTASTAEHPTEKKSRSSSGSSADTSRDEDLRFGHQHLGGRRPGPRVADHNHGIRPRHQLPHSPNYQEPSLPAPTVQPGSHAFASPAVAPQPLPAPPVVSQPYQPPPQAVQPHPGRGVGLLPPPAPMVMPTVRLTEPHPRYPTTTAYPVAPGIPQQPRVQVAHNPMPPLPPSDPSKGMDSIPANNRIFVDGRPYEVRYIEDIPVIERNGVPHKIYFTGPPRDVVIDGKAHSLAFGDRKSVVIDGQSHVIRFGAPSRELYMGSYPFRGAFGGPPIYATINGVRHEIRLCGPPPEVKIEPEPCYELTRFMPQQKAHRGGLIDTPAPAAISQQGPQPAPSAPVSLDISALLAKLKEGGILPSSQPPAALPAHLATTGKPQSGGQSPHRPPTPPIPSGVLRDGEEVERANLPPPTLKEFSIRTLKLRYKSVIDNLYPANKSCTTCGLRFAEHDALRYNRHLDWHFREARAAKNGMARSRPWYYAVEDWVRYTEQGDDPAKTAKSAVFENEGQESNDAAQPPPVTVSVPTTDNNTCCPVCAEEFETVYDDDDEEWRYVNAIVVGGQVYHPICAQDASFEPNSAVGEAAFLVGESRANSSYSTLPGLDVSANAQSGSESSNAQVKSEPDTTVNNRLSSDTTNVVIASATPVNSNTTTTTAATHATAVIPSRGVDPRATPGPCAPQETGRDWGTVKREPGDIDVAALVKSVSTDSDDEADVKPFAGSSGGAVEPPERPQTPGTPTRDE